VRIAADGKWIEERELQWAMNEPDAYALEEALQLKEKHGGEVIVLSAGPSAWARRFARPSRRARTGPSILCATTWARAPAAVFAISMRWCGALARRGHQARES